MTDPYEDDIWPAPWILPTRHVPATVDASETENGREDTPTVSDAAAGDSERRDRYAEAIALSEGVTPGTDSWHDVAARAVLPLVDAELSALSVVHEREVAELRAEVSTVREAGAVLCEQIRSDWERLARMMRIARKRGDDVENLRVSREGMRLQRDYTRLQRDEQKADADSLGDALVEEVARAEAAESREAALREAVEALAAWYEGQPNWVEWGIHRQIRAVLAQVGAADTRDEGAGDPFTAADLGQIDATPTAGSKVDAAPEADDDCPHAAPFRYCDGCKVDPCPIGLGGSS